jgi:exonuclease VII large subunit
VVITGVGSVAVDDIRSQLREAEADLDLQVVQVPMSRPAEVTAAPLGAGNAHAVIVTRGGGEGVHVLDDDLIRAVAASPVFVAVALGHASDDLVIGRVADANFPTPTAFGAWLRSAVDEKRARHRQVAEGKLLLQSQSLVDQLKGLQASAARWQLIALVAVAGLAAAVIWHLLRLP